MLSPSLKKIALVVKTFCENGGKSKPSLQEIVHVGESKELLYSNDAYKNATINYANFFCNLKKIEIDNDNPLLNIQRISFELSNICNYSFIHKKCPTSAFKTKVVLDTSIILKTVDELQQIDYSGIISFHRYNEPLIDPRLFYLLQYVKNKLPAAKILILSNGFYMTQSILDLLSEFNVWNICCSAYSNSEFSRLSALDTHLPYSVFSVRLDDRLGIYEQPTVDCTNPCLAPLRDITVNCYGQINLCCLDYLNTVNFGDLGRSSLMEIITSNPFVEATDKLSRGARTFQICQRCDWSR